MQEKLLEFVILVAKLFGRKHKTLESLRRKEQFLDSFKQTDKSDVEGQIKLELNFQHLYGIFLNRDVMKTIISSPKGGAVLHYLERGASYLELDDMNSFVYHFRFHRYANLFIFLVGILFFPASLLIAIETIKSSSLLIELLSGVCFSGGAFVCTASALSHRSYRCADRVIKLYKEIEKTE